MTESNTKGIAMSKKKKGDEMSAPETSDLDVSEDEITVENDEEMVDVEDENLAFPDDSFEPLPCQVSGIVEINQCVEHDGRIIALVSTRNTVRRSRYPVQHVMLMPAIFQKGEMVAVAGQVVERQLWVPARVQGRLIPVNGEIVGADVLTQLIDATSAMSVDKDLTARLSAYIKVQLDEFCGKAVNENRSIARRNQRSNRRMQSWQQDLNKKNLGPRDRLLWEGKTGNGFSIHVEVFYSDRWNQGRMDKGSILELEIPPQWGKVNKESIEIKKSNGDVLQARIGRNNEATRLPVMVTPMQFRAVIQTRLLDEDRAAGAIDNDVYVDGDDVETHAGTLFKFNQ